MPSDESWVIIVIVILVILAAAAAVAWYVRRRGMIGQVIRGRGEPATFGGARRFRLAVREPWFGYATKGKKTVVGRLRVGPFAADARRPLKEGDDVVVARSRAKGDETEYGRPYRYPTTITHLKEYDTFKDMIKGEGISKVFPGAKTESAALKVYSEFYDEAAQQGAKVLAIGVAPPTKEVLAAAAKPPADSSSA